MKDFPAVRIAIAFVLGILSQQIIALRIEYIFIPIAILSISLLPFFREKIYYKNSFSITLFALILIIMIGNVHIKSNVYKKNEFFDKIYRAKNVSLTGEVVKIDLKRENELLFYTQTDTIQSDKFYVNDRIKLLCRFRDEVININELYNNLKPGNKVVSRWSNFPFREF